MHKQQYLVLQHSIGICDDGRARRNSGASCVAQKLLRNFCMLVEDVGGRIYRNAVEIYGIMKVWASASPGVAHLSNEIAALYRVPAFYQGFVNVAVVGYHAVAVIDDDIIAQIAPRSH
jgi:hypothetical protein